MKNNNKFKIFVSQTSQCLFEKKEDDLINKNKLEKVSIEVIRKIAYYNSNIGHNKHLVFDLERCKKFLDRYSKHVTEFRTFLNKKTINLQTLADCLVGVDIDISSLEENVSIQNFISSNEDLGIGSLLTALKKYVEFSKEVVEKFLDSSSMPGAYFLQVLQDKEIAWDQGKRNFIIKIIPYSSSILEKVEVTIHHQNSAAKLLNKEEYGFKECERDYFDDFDKCLKLNDLQSYTFREQECIFLFFLRYDRYKKLQPGDEVKLVFTVRKPSNQTEEHTVSLKFQGSTSDSAYKDQFRELKEKAKKLKKEKRSVQIANFNNFKKKVQEIVDKLVSCMVETDVFSKSFSGSNENIEEFEKCLTKFEEYLGEFEKYLDNKYRFSEKKLVDYLVEVAKQAIDLAEKYDSIEEYIAIADATNSVTVNKEKYKSFFDGLKEGLEFMIKRGLKWRVYLPLRDIIEERYYELLGLKRDESLQEIEKAYKKMMLKYHPDKNVSKEEKIKQELNKYSQEATKARQVLLALQDPSEFIKNKKNYRIHR